MADTIMDYGPSLPHTRLLKGAPELPNHRVNPLADACRVHGGHRIFVELPGVAVPDVLVAVSDGLVIVAGRKSMRPDTQGSTWFFRESELGSFRREFRLPQGADTNKIEVVLQDGLLRIYLPDVSPADHPGKAEIVSFSGRRGR